MDVKALITRKIGMTSTINEDGTVQAVTVLDASPNTILHIKNQEKDGYLAVQLGFGTSKANSKAVLGHVKKSKVTPKIIREFRIKNMSDDLKIGETVTADSFNIGDIIDVVGLSKGKGFAGTIKRHNFHRQRKTHGGKGNTRKPGSIGSMYPQKIFKGKKMAGQMGHERVTIKNLKVVMVDSEKNIIGVSGAVPGPNKEIVLVKGAA